MNASQRSSGFASRLAQAGSVLVLFLGLGTAEGAHGGGGHGGHVEMHGDGGFAGFHHGGGHPNEINFNPGIYFGYGVGGGYAYSPSLLVVGQGGFAPFLGPAFPQGNFPMGMGMGMGMGAVGGGGLMLPAPPRGLVDLNLNPNQPRVRRTSPARAKELVDIGDRSFRVHNIKRAEEKYLLAAKADPTAPAPHIHLAQVSMARGNYSAAADHLRDAVSVAPDGAWLVNAPDIQAIFGEPADFARQLARLETHLQVNPNDRDAWFVLGAESYLSGRTRQASDAFQRLTDRRPDQALTAFLDASRPQPAAAN